MNNAKPKTAVRKVTKSLATAHKILSRSLVPQPSRLPKGPRDAVRSDGALPERLMNALGPFVTVSIADARTQMPKMVRSSASGHIFLIRNARLSDAPAAVLIGLEELNRVVAEPIKGRTLSDVVAALPFSGMSFKPLTAGTLPGPGLPTALLPK